MSNEFIDELELEMGDAQGGGGFSKALLQKA